MRTPYILPPQPDYIIVTKAANQSIATGVAPIKLTLDTIISVQGISFDTVNNAVIMQKRGLYNIEAACRFTAHATGERYLCVAVNGVNTYFHAYDAPAVLTINHEFHFNLKSVILNAADSVTFLVAQNSGVANLNLAVANLLPTLKVTQVR